jgi:hypothetical protein
MDFNNQFYYYCGNFSFTLVVGVVVGGLSDFPFLSILRVPYSARDTSNEEDICA